MHPYEKKISTIQPYTHTHKHPVCRSSTSYKKWRQMHKRKLSMHITESNWIYIGKKRSKRLSLIQMMKNIFTIFLSSFFSVCVCLSFLVFKKFLHYFFIFFICLTWSKHGCLLLFIFDSFVNNFFFSFANFSFSFSFCFVLFCLWNHHLSYSSSCCCYSSSSSSNVLHWTRAHIISHRHHRLILLYLSGFFFLKI